MIDVRFWRLKSNLALKRLKYKPPPDFLWFSGMSQINFKAYYILFHKPLNGCIFLSFIQIILKIREKKYDRIHVLYQKTSHTHLDPSYHSQIAYMFGSSLY